MIRSTDERSDAELVSDILANRSREASDEAYRALLGRYWKVVVVLVRSRLPSARDAEDVAQEAFIRAWRSLDRLENPRLFLGWLLRIAQNRATDHLRRRRREISIETLADGSLEAARRWGGDPPSASEERVENEEEWQMAREALDRLSEPYRTAVVLRYLKGLSNQEMARSLGEPEGTIRNRLFRGLRKLRRAMRQKDLSAKNP